MTELGLRSISLVTPVIIHVPRTSLSYKEYLSMSVKEGRRTSPALEKSSHDNHKVNSRITSRSWELAEDSR